MLGDPSAPSHDYSACLQAIDFAVASVGHADKSGFSRLTFVLDAYGGRLQADANLICRAIQRAKIHPISANCFKRMRTGNSLRDKCLHNMPRETRVAVGKAMALDV